MSYTAALDHLLALTQELASDPALAQEPTIGSGLAPPRRKFDLDHMRTLARALGDPQTRFPSVLIAGTNGKGSTAATLAAILTAAGLRTGLYTSPHLIRVTERIRTSGPTRVPQVRPQVDPGNTPSPLLEISEPDFARLYFRVDDAARELVTTGALPHHPSFFETLTALAFLYFAEQELDIAVLEVGLGGRLDATNIVSPLISVITDIALDHQDYLGSTITEIASEKAGILRPGGTLITLPQHPEANQAIGEAAIALNVRAISATPYLPDRNSLEPRTSNLEPLEPLEPNRYTLHLGAEPLYVQSPLAGQHQQRNIALAIAAALELLASPSPLTPHSNLESRTSNLIKSIEAGIANTSWPGRLEFLPPYLLLDVAHNPAGAWTLRAAISTLPESRPRTLIFSCLRDKDLTEISRILFPLFDSSTATRVPQVRPQVDPRNTHASLNLILTPIDNPRAASLDSLLAAAAALSIPAHAVPNAVEALALARRITPPEGLIVATGSIYLIGALRQAALAWL